MNPKNQKLEKDQELLKNQKPWRNQKLQKVKKLQKVLVTRPAHLAVSLANELKNAGFIPELLPTIECKPTPKQLALKKSVQALGDVHLAIFVSMASVQYGMEAILSVWPEPPKMLYAAIGPATKKSLETYGITNIISPKEPPHESESLLEDDALQTVAVKDKKIVIFRADDGRNLLAKTLQKRGAKLKIIECYQRVAPKLNIARKLKTWNEDPVHVSLVTSSAILKSLHVLLKSKGFSLLKKQPMIVVGLRMKALATTLGITQIIVAKAADDQSLLQALINFRDQIQ